MAVLARTLLLVRQERQTAAGKTKKTGGDSMKETKTGGSRVRKTAASAALALMTLLYVLDLLLPLPLGAAAAAAAAAVLLLDLPFMGKTFRLPAWIFFLLGAAVLLFCRAPLSQWEQGLSSMMKTVVILVVMQGLALAMRRGGYEQAAAECLCGRSGSLAGLFCLILLLSHLLAGVMSLGCVVVILAAISPAVRQRLPDSRRFLAASLSWGYCTLFLWAPGTVTVLMSMQVFDLDWQSYFPPAFALSLLGLALGAGIAHFRFRGQSLASAGTETVSLGAWRKLRRLAGVLAVIVAAVALLERLGFSTSIGRLLVTILTVTAVWLTAQGRVPEAPPLLRQWWQDYLPKNQDLAAFFLSMGVFSAAIQYSGFGDRLTELCAGHSGLLGPLVLPLLPLAIVAFSLVGLHPFVSVLMVGPILAGLPLPVTPLQLGLAMSLGCCLSYMLSPFAGLILTLSHELQEPPLRMCLRANLPFAIPYYLLATLAITWLC